MKKWTELCQEITYTATGRVFCGGEWMEFSNRGSAVFAMASQREDIIRVLTKAFDVVSGAFKSLGERIAFASQTGGFFMVPRPEDSSTWWRRSFQEDKPVLTGPGSTRVVFSDTK